MVHLVTAVIRPEKLEPVLVALTDAGATGMTVTDVRGYGHEPIRTGTFRGSVYKTVFIPKVKVEILCDTFDAEHFAKVVAAEAATGQVGDGKVWISEIASVTRIRTSDVDVLAI